MTVQYNADVATASFAGFLRLLGRWRGSVYKLLWRDFLIYFLIYWILQFVDWWALNASQKQLFMEVSLYCRAYSALIPVNFVLGFYVTSVVGRWWDQFNAIPWPARFAILVTSHIRGTDDHTRMIRRSLVRYMSLGFVYTMTSICPAVKLRFPTHAHLTMAGLMMPHEQELLESTETKYNKFYLPFMWASTLIARCRQEGKIKDEYGMQCLSDEITSFRQNCQMLFNYDWVCIPIVYTQVVTISVYTYTLALLIGEQYTGTGDFPFPFFLFLQFFFYQGWLKVGEELLNPFGEDDDDFEINSIIDTYLQCSYLIVDTMHQELPDMIRDMHWDVKDVVIPYTEAALKYQKGVGSGATAFVEAPDAKAQFLETNAERFSTVLEADEEGDEKEGRQSVYQGLAPAYNPSYTTRSSLGNQEYQSSIPTAATRKSLVSLPPSAVPKDYYYVPPDPADNKVFTDNFMNALQQQLNDVRTGEENGPTWLNREKWD